MLACSKCRRSMVCVKTGCHLVWHWDHAKAGDEFECKGCGARVVHAPYGDYHLTPAEREANTYTKYIDMVEGD